MKVPFSTQGLSRISSRHPWKVVLVWLGVLVLSIAISYLLLGDALTSQVSLTNNPDSEVGKQLLEDRLRGEQHAREIVIVQSETLRVEDAEFRRAVEGIAATLEKFGA